MIRIAMLIRSARLLSMPLLSIAVALAAPGAHAQQPQPVPPVPPVHQPAMSADNSGLDNPRDPEQARMLHEMSKDRNAQRQKEIVADTNQLMDLAKQLKDAVAKSNKNELSLSVINTANEIEKLAKSVKDKMRDGQ